MTLYHGTSIKKCKKIKKSGFLKNPYLTDDIRVAQYYAETMADEDDSLPIIFEITDADESCFLFDSAAMDEPVGQKEKSRDDAWEKASVDHPEWCSEEDLSMISIPPNAYIYSLEGVSSIKYNGMLDFCNLKLINL
jgi:hypothetical protein